MAPFRSTATALKQLGYDEKRLSLAEVASDCRDNFSDCEATR